MVSQRRRPDLQWIVGPHDESALVTGDEVGEAAFARSGRLALEDAQTIARISIRSLRGELEHLWCREE